MEAAPRMEQESERAVFSRMVHEHHRMLLVYARTLVRDEGDARELVQDALVAAWRTLRRFDVTRDTGPWLRGIIRNKWRDYCRRKGRRPEFTDDQLGELEADLTAWDEARDSLFETLRECRERLPEAFAQAVSAVYDEGLTGEEAAVRFQVQAATFRKRLERARSALQDCLKESLAI